MTSIPRSLRLLRWMFSFAVATAGVVPVGARAEDPRAYEGPPAVVGPRPAPERVPKLPPPEVPDADPERPAMGPPEDGAPEPEQPRTWVVGATVDVSYVFNSNLPDNHVYRGMVPTPRTGEFALNVATASIEHDPTPDEPWKLQVLLHAGSGVDALVEYEPVAGGADGRYAGAETFKHIGLANAGLQTRSGTTIVGGLMPAPLGIEWFWPDRNDHQTASWTANGTPFYLMGGQVRQRMGAGVELFGYVVNGWQTLSDLNAVPSYVAGVHYQPRSELAAAAMVYFGPDDEDISPEAWRVNADTSVAWSGERLGLAVVWDLGQERLTAVPGEPVALWTGGGVFARGTAVDREPVGLDFAVRPEAWWDRDGRIYGVPQWLLSGTATASLRLYDHVLVRAEYRFDHSTSPSGFFYRGGATSDDAPDLARNQHIVGVSLVGYLRHAFAGRR